MYKKGQVSHEALMILGMIFFIFIVVLSIYFLKSADVVRFNTQIEERTECLKLANTISGIFYLGGQVDLTLYQDLTVFPEQQRIETEHTFCTLPLDNILYGGSSEEFDLVQGNFIIKKSGDLVVINNG